MAYIKNLFDKNFIEYASYVIRSRAIPDLEDGLKPVQRRIMHTLFQIDDGRMHKVAGVVGECMKYHPHGDASIGAALVVLANKGVFIERQGNFGNMYTGDGASASRYIECCVHPLAKDFLYNPNITEYIPSYDGRGKEPIAFRAKLPVVLIGGAEGIAVGMSTKILPYNIKEVIDAEIKALKGEPFEIYPDVPTGGLIDVSNYNDGNGKIVTRAKLDLSDEKRIVITELPVDTNSKDLLDSIDNAYKNGKIKISSVEDFTTDHCELEIKLPRGVYAKDVEKALYACTLCEKSIACQMLVIKDNMPVAMTATEIIKYYAQKLTAIIKDELEYERNSLTEDLHARTLERIFIEERIYKEIEQMKTAEAVNKAVKKGFVPYKAELIREVTDDDVERLLKIPIRRISLFDINKNREQVKAINARLKEIAKRLKHLTECAVEYLEGISGELESFTKLDSKKDPRAIDPKLLKRQTKITKFGRVDVKDAVSHDLPLRYDDNSGYLGLSVSAGREVMRVSPYDRVFVLRRTGVYTVFDVPQKVFIDKNMWYCGSAEKAALSKVLFTIIYRDLETKFAYIKRCRVEQYIMNRDYAIVPDGTEILCVETREKFGFILRYEEKPRIKITSEAFKAQSYEEKGLKAQGVRLAPREVASIEVEPPHAAPAAVQGDDSPKGGGSGGADVAPNAEDEAAEAKSAPTAKAAPKSVGTSAEFKGVSVKATPKSAPSPKPAEKPAAKSSAAKAASPSGKTAKTAGGAKSAAGSSAKVASASKESVKTAPKASAKSASAAAKSAPKLAADSAKVAGTAKSAGSASSAKLAVAAKSASATASAKPAGSTASAKPASSAKSASSSASAKSTSSAVAAKSASPTASAKAAGGAASAKPESPSATVKPTASAKTAPSTSSTKSVTAQSSASVKTTDSASSAKTTASVKSAPSTASAKSASSSASAKSTSSAVAAKPASAAKATPSTGGAKPAGSTVTAARPSVLARISSVQRNANIVEESALATMETKASAAAKAEEEKALAALNAPKAAAAKPAQTEGGEKKGGLAAKAEKLTKK